jgi:hypothetical protein
VSQHFSAKTRVLPVGLHFFFSSLFEVSPGGIFTVLFRIESLEALYSGPAVLFKTGYFLFVSNLSEKRRMKIN